MIWLNPRFLFMCQVEFTSLQFSRSSTVKLSYPPVMSYYCIIYPKPSTRLPQDLHQVCIICFSRHLAVAITVHRIMLPHGMSCHKREYCAAGIAPDIWNACMTQSIRCTVSSIPATLVLYFPLHSRIFIDQQENLLLLKTVRLPASYY